MNDENNPSSSDEDGGTRVDLGDDLLREKTVVISGALGSITETTALPNPFLETSGEKTEGSPGSVQDLLESAKIFSSEGLIEDAKKTLHRVLIMDPGNVIAKDLLVEIHELELKQIMDGGRDRRPVGRKVEISPPEIDVELLIRELDRDLNLGIFSEVAPSATIDQLSLFEDPELLQGFLKKLEKDMAGSHPRDWMDLGIGFLEMELYGVAIHLFAGACRRIDPGTEETGEMLLSATCLLAFALILAGRPFEAVARIQPMLRDVEIKRESKTELIYLMGRTYESMKKRDFALSFYKQVLEMDPQYRDVDQRLRKLSIPQYD